jgi:hypothetical protein
LKVIWQDHVPHLEILQRTKLLEHCGVHHTPPALDGSANATQVPEDRLLRKRLCGQLQLGRRSAGGQKNAAKGQTEDIIKELWDEPCVSPDCCCGVQLAKE